ncbi:MAG TPA: Asp-tRNA(Asn)/Glu-tRNA(Gln) amidotransferase subunit GatC [Gammaproteobacteria bacterium]|nr:Asp-tRNA(Asn)/Glu-tRNA(Gln) amidotransferase subunit GatC [Gammaproteobacteria bacterium]
MSVTKDDIHHIAHLARLNLDETRVPEYTQNLNNLLELVSQMEKINTENIEPMAHPLDGQQQRFRDDKITEQNQRDRFQKIAPEIVEGLYIVPQVIE